MIRSGIPVSELEPYLHARAWLSDAARLLDRTPEALATELVDTMLRSGAVVVRDERLHAAAEHTPVAVKPLRIPFPRTWPLGTSATTRAGESHEGKRPEQFDPHRSVSAPGDLCQQLK
jgi:hypothetical protein